MSNNNEKHFEIKCGLTLSVFAAVLAVADLYSGKFGDGEMKAINEKASAFMWYQAKSIKATAVEGHMDLLNSLLKTGSIAEATRPSIQRHAGTLREETARYKREMKEILLGSSKVGEAGWSQEVNGEKGKVTGALEWQETAERLSQAGDRLDLAKLLLQLCLVLGAVSLVLQNEKPRQLFYAVMCVAGSAGAVITGWSLAG